jgi:serine/threonine protein kinase
MSKLSDLPELLCWFAAQNLRNLTQIAKDSPQTRAWFASDDDERELFLKLYPPEFAEPHAAIEIAIAGSNLHPAIVPLRQTVPCREGLLLIYDRVPGENLGPMAARGRFHALPLPARVAAVSHVIEALAAIAEAGFMVVDWYEGNMIYDFDRRRIWLFDWELCRRGEGFTLEMDSNYGSSRLMAPEEFVRGSWLDQRTLVFNLGRYALLALPELAEPLAPLLARATYPARSARFPTVREFAEAFAEAIS